jgi:hypothetical protein
VAAAAVTPAPRMKALLLCSAMVMLLLKRPGRVVPARLL